MSLGATNVHPGLGVADRHLGEHLDGGVVHDLAFLHNPVVAKRRKRVERHVRHDHHVRDGTLDGLHRTLHQTLGVEGLRAGVVLERVVHLNEQQDAFQTVVAEDFHVLHRQIEASLEVAGHGRNLARHPLPFEDKQRRDEVLAPHGMLGHEVAQSLSGGGDGGVG